jgi:hypothetical protein
VTRPHMSPARPEMFPSKCQWLQNASKCLK